MTAGGMGQEPLGGPAGGPVGGEPTGGPGAEPAGGELVRGPGEEAADLPARSRGVIGLLEENCTVCMLCARECPDWCIYIDSHKEPVPGPSGSAGSPAESGGSPRGSGGSAGGSGATPAGRGRQRVRNVLDRFAIDFSLCMYCGICIEACPYDALFWSPEYSYATTDIKDLTHERDRLREWMWTVPPPPAHDPGAQLPREAIAAGAASPDAGPGWGPGAGPGGAGAGPGGAGARPGGAGARPGDTAGGAGAEPRGAGAGPGDAAGGAVPPGLT
jgi:NADH-quinone oxidoreductase subunit I